MLDKTLKLNYFASEKKNSPGNPNGLSPISSGQFSLSGGPDNWINPYLQPLNQSTISEPLHP
jgi:hypothetical protein